MDQQYETAARAVEDLRHRARDMFDDPGHSLSRQLIEDTERLSGDIRNRKNPHTLEDQTEDVMRLLQQMRSSSEAVMSSPDADSLYRSYEQLRMSFRKFENY